MDDIKTYQRELAAEVPIEAPLKDESKNTAWVTRLIMVTLQIIVAVSIFQLIMNVLFNHGISASSNIYFIILGCTLATICAYLILMKYQMLIQDFSRDNVQLAERLGARTYALEKANDSKSTG